MKLWPVGQVRPIRFHHIRHTTASLLMMAGADLPAVQRIMRHTDPRITTEFYGHLAPGYLRSAIDASGSNRRRPPRASPLAKRSRQPHHRNPPSSRRLSQFAAPLLQTRKTGVREPSDDSEEPPHCELPHTTPRPEKGSAPAPPRLRLLNACA
jgi:hypothetical protein